MKGGAAPVANAPPPGYLETKECFLPNLRPSFLEVVVHCGAVEFQLI